MMMKRPAESEYALYYGTYVSLVPEADVAAVLEAQPAQLRLLAGAIGQDRETYRYAPGKWSIREVLGHVVDTERVFGYRAFSIGRGEQQPLARFDQDAYLAASGFDKRPLADLVHEFAVVREANLLTLRHLTDTDWDRIGTVSGNPMSARAIAFIMAGHLRHHLRVLQEQYGIKRPT
jgi:hypothetical protein